MDKYQQVDTLLRRTPQTIPDDFQPNEMKVMLQSFNPLFSFHNNCDLLIENVRKEIISNQDTFMVNQLPEQAPSQQMLVQNVQDQTVVVDAINQESPQSFFSSPQIQQIYEIVKKNTQSLTLENRKLLSSELRKILKLDVDE